MIHLLLVFIASIAGAMIGWRAGPVIAFLFLGVPSLLVGLAAGLVVRSARRQ